MVLDRCKEVREGKMPSPARRMRALPRVIAALIKMRMRECNDCADRGGERRSPRGLQMNGWNLRFRRKSVGFGLAENQEKRVNAAHGRFHGIVKLRVVVTMFSQLLHTLRSPCAQIIEPPEHDRFSRTNFRAGRSEPALLSVVTKSAFECAAGVGQRLRAPIDHAKRAGNDAIPAAIANIVLHQHRTDFSAHDRAGRTRFEATRFLTMLANIGKKNPAKWIVSIAVA